jgi:hypothetical protein
MLRALLAVARQIAAAHNRWRAQGRTTPAADGSSNSRSCASASRPTPARPNVRLPFGGDDRM